MRSGRRTSRMANGLAVTALWLGWLRAGVACPIPVFQFSLEHWGADPYAVEVQHAGAFTEDQQSAIERLEAAQRGDGTPSNIALTWRDYSQAAIAPPAGRALPHLIVNYPSVSGIRRTLWEGPLERRTVDALLDSPMRRTVARKLLDRHAAVWVLLRSGNRSADRKAQQLLEAELTRLEATLKVPDPPDGFGEIHTRITFSMVTLDRDDPEEQMLIRMLLGSEPDLDEYADQPMVFPVYGRGLIMYALIGDGINRWTLASAGRFLTGPCSCQVKQNNPGVDLLTTLDWDAKVEQLTTYLSGPVAPDAGAFLDRMKDAEEQLR